MVTPFPSRFRPPPDPPPPDLPPWSLCKSRPFKARFLIVPPEPPEPPDVPLLLAPLLQTLESSINLVVFLSRFSSPVPVSVASPLRFQHSSSFQLEPQFIFAETSSLLVKLSKGVSCLKMSPLPLNEDIVLPLNLILPQFEDVASDRSLPLYEDDVTLCSAPLVPQYGVGTRTFALLALVSMVSGTDASKNRGLGWCIHGMDEAHDSQSSARILYVVSTFAAKALTLQVALPSASSAGFSKLQEIWDSIVLFSALHSGIDLNEIAGCLLTNLATLFSPLSFNFYQCTALCLAVAIAMCVFFRLCSSITLF
ncbi:BnaA06g15060D [Brassica napus]|uniref:BnaA06g15060D protein n=1 Tax=Brassica napus TaxID=3708 RepID=A0A078GWC5_BRANA|nr:BnaA06g15060D [Brassica napus]